MKNNKSFSDKINVLHIRDSGGIHGAERVMLTLANNIDKNFCSVSFLCLRRPDGRTEPFINQSKEMGINLYNVWVKSKFDIKAILNIRKIFKQKKIQIFHSHDFKSNLYGLLASLGLNVKRVTTAHGSTRDSMKKRIYLFIDEKITYKFFHKVVSVSNELNEFLVNRGVKSSKIQTIQNGFDVNVLLSTPVVDEKPILIPERKKVFCIIGRLFLDKGHKYFIEAFEKIYKTNKDIFGLIIGDGPEFHTIQDKIQQLNLEESIILCGTRSNIAEIYKIIDFVVMPSLTEGLPYVLLEALAMGVPVLASSVGDIPLVVQDKKTGYLVPPADVDQLELVMKYFLEYPEEVKLKAENGKNHIYQYFSAAKMARETESLYKELQ
jgi:glycosyltransferase involved in cell wall biosynthesis